MDAFFTGAAQKLLSRESKKNIVKLFAAVTVGLAGMGVPFHTVQAAPSDKAITPIKMEDRSWGTAEETGLRQMFGMTGEVTTSLSGIPAQNGRPPVYMIDVRDPNGVSLSYRLSGREEELTVTKGDKTTVYTKDSEGLITENGTRILTGVSADPQAEVLKNRTAVSQMKSMQGYVFRRLSEAMPGNPSAQGRKTTLPSADIK